ncbi:hypothetical protein D3C71_1330000 [compost metagenome]
MSEALPKMVLQVTEASVPTAAAGWHLTYGYGMKPLILYASKGQTVWRDGARVIPITHYAGPLLEAK